MKNTRREFRLPDGNHTNSIHRYLAEWRKLNKVVEQKLGCLVYAYNPGVAIMLPDGSGACTLPLWVAKKIANQEETPSAPVKKVSKALPKLASVAYQQGISK